MWDLIEYLYLYSTTNAKYAGLIVPRDCECVGTLIESIKHGLSVPVIDSLSSRRDAECRSNKLHLSSLHHITQYKVYMLHYFSINYINMHYIPLSLILSSRGRSGGLWLSNDLWTGCDPHHDIGSLPRPSNEASERIQCLHGWPAHGFRGPSSSHETRRSRGDGHSSVQVVLLSVAGRRHWLMTGFTRWQYLPLWQNGSYQWLHMAEHLYGTI